MAKQPFGPATPSLSTHVLLLDGGKVLMMRRALDDAYAPGLWHASVACRAELGKGLLSTAVRQAHEELGVVLEPSDLQFAHVVHSQESRDQACAHFFFVCRRWQGTPVNREPHKYTHLSWWPAHKLPADTVDYCAQAVALLLSGTRFSQYPPNAAHAVHRSPEPQTTQLGDAGVPGSLARVLGDIADERRRQQTLYGIQRLPSGTDSKHELQAAQAQARVDTAGEGLTWWDLAFEELCEARATEDPQELYAELIQTCAVLTQWAQSIPRP